MNTKDTFEIIQAMYSNRPFKSESGEIIFVPDPLDRLINACELVETLLYTSSGISTAKYEQFLEMTRDFLFSIPVDVLQAGSKNLERNARDILLRNLDKIVSISDDTRISEYSAILEYGT